MLKKYYYLLEDGDYNEYPAGLNDGNNYKKAVKEAKEWMRRNGVRSATLVVNSISTEAILRQIELKVKI